jgi:hypothetical protein
VVVGTLTGSPTLGGYAVRVCLPTPAEEP